MTTEELRKKEMKELEKEVIELRKKLNDLRFKLASNQVKNPKEMGNFRKDIARILTIIKEKRQHV